MPISLDQVLLWLAHYKYWALFPLAVIEGPIITVIAGFFTSLGYLNFLVVYLVIVAGDLAGDIVHYVVGRWGGRHFVNRWGKYVGLGSNEMGSLEGQFAKRGDKLLFIGKMTHGVGGAFLIAAGVIKMPFAKFFYSNMLATFVKSALLLIIGFYFGYALSTISSILQKIALLSIGIGALLLLIYFFYFRKKTRRLPKPV